MANGETAILTEYAAFIVADYAVGDNGSAIETRDSTSFVANHSTVVNLRRGKYTPNPRPTIDDCETI